MTLVPYFAAHVGLSQHWLHGFPFPGVPEKVPWIYPFLNCARATAHAMNWMDQIFPDVNMTV
jgi:hypothetical protein